MLKRGNRVRGTNKSTQNLIKFTCWTQGMLIAISDVVATSKVTMALWKHECTRVIADRFTMRVDKEWFEKSLKQVSTILQIKQILFYSRQQLKKKGYSILIVVTVH